MSTNNNAQVAANKKPGKARPALSLHIPRKPEPVSQTAAVMGAAPGVNDLPESAPVNSIDVFIHGAGTPVEAAPAALAVPAAVVPVAALATVGENDEKLPVTATKPPETTVETGKSESADLVERLQGFILRLTPTQMREIELVLKESKYKSKQQMGEALLMKGVAELKAALDIK